MPLHLMVVEYVYFKTKDILLNNDPNQENNFGTILLSKSTDFNTVLPVIPETSFLEIVSVVQDSIQDQYCV